MATAEAAWQGGQVVSVFEVVTVGDETGAEAGAETSAPQTGGDGGCSSDGGGSGESLPERDPAGTSDGSTADGTAADGQGRRRRLLLRLRPGLRLLMYVSQPPCGDASILDTLDVAQHLGDGAAPGASSGIFPVAAPCGGASARRVAAAPAEGNSVPQARDVDVDEQHAGAAAGRVRRKPGRGDATLSLSCSDKIARWCCLGVQGCLLSGLLERPLHLDLLAVGATPAMQSAAGLEAAQAAVLSAAQRAFAGRLLADAAVMEATVAHAPFALRTPRLAALPPPPAALGLSPDAARKVPSERTRSRLCRAAMLRRLCNLLGQLPQVAQQVLLAFDHDGAAAMEASCSPLLCWSTLPYRRLKRLLGGGYCASWDAMRNAPGSMFAFWLPKPEGHQDFMEGLAERALRPEPGVGSE
ncbi:hypothetical protein GPECTOR_49g501 [Gonium pectorale]|uniref:tRNA-specific adenosine deaminase 1 n=1 Tax=Gonium pectorale TaxID=33097 RepID=A0A150G7U3_GONPE|nr:hypothetical protein GPECTOR_49g501 [Gonium pectorale]|eukprot:KXZ45917.1 hypothetical protein GPECTOR_49g501 [Gonium pectorale]